MTPAQHIIETKELNLLMHPQHKKMRILIFVKYSVATFNCSLYRETTWCLMVGVKFFTKLQLKKSKLKKKKLELKIIIGIVQVEAT